MFNVVIDPLRLVVAPPGVLRGWDHVGREHVVEPVGQASFGVINPATV